MIGKEESLKAKRCPLCGGSIREGQTIAHFFIRDKIIIIKDVPAEVCLDCDEAYMASGVVGEIECILDRLEDLHSEVSIIHFKAA
ncbi:MAG: YgiT-type zinc finger protein [Nitrospirae bacterium]|uniref:YgiT-type zinc finger protein n=1 Tax=Candidatus Magnetobacterium casense TaxID=1455061 RepID=UPI00058AFA97|nr:YgiT-type zinc finger protein [Candidatus Magnetobacterium casensis]MBF0338158.1 YgiT-type zinc finger protein [Nitrospirota bacterium]